MLSRTKRWFLIYIPAIILAAFLFLYLENNAIGVTSYRISSEKLPQGFDSYRIVQLSDLQSKDFGRNQRPLVSKVEKLKPDLIVVTGDLVDANHYDGEASLAMMKGIAEIAPVYFVAGNHEYAAEGYPGLENELRELGIHVLRNEHEVIPLGDGFIRIAGVDDPIFDRAGDGDVDKMNNHLAKAFENIGHPEAYTILLTHRAELFEVYAEHGIDLSFAGHAHGGQFRIPFVGGVYSPEQGFWPKLSEGKHENDGSTLIINRGLGNSTFPQRLFNRPEIVSVDLANG
ncbi:metallophosphoesterase [Paenibacillus sp. LHD-117]|uniref:metallophosphoesterase n=1 Tax=Paenibacillus sp. LHD-117 TaxID=3071412 RepID=UPI0027E20AED|nr:metallophosphoesterase [Paenibacillus sp. LHD-117]MDQ6419704.1 metallophosphoesterase [Paenibacillus sp. LHD-117]